MPHFITQYILELNALYKADNATEHSYRPALKTLLEALTNFTATNEPKRIACGAPDYIITDRNFAVGYVEAKDIPVNLNGKSLKEQFERYKNSLDNLIITNYLTFRWYAKARLLAESINKGKWILNLLDNYKKEPTGGRLQKKNSKWLNAFVTRLTETPFSRAVERHTSERLNAIHPLG